MKRKRYSVKQIVAAVKQHDPGTRTRLTCGGRRVVPVDEADRDRARLPRVFWRGDRQALSRRPCDRAPRFEDQARWAVAEARLQRTAHLACVGQRGPVAIRVVIR